MEVNRVEMIGRIGFINCKATNKGLMVTNILLSKKVKEEFQSFNVTIFGELAEILAETAQKGDYIHVIGKLVDDSYEGKDGKKVNKTVIYATEAELVNYNVEKRSYESKNVTENNGDKAPWEK